MIRLIKFLCKFTGLESIACHLSDKWFEYIKIFTYLMLTVLTLDLVSIVYFYFNMPNFPYEFQQIPNADFGEISLLFFFFTIFGAMIVMIWGGIIFFLILMAIIIFFVVLFIIKAPKMIKKWFNDCWDNSNQ